ncbi:MAG TPA: hypothetical protein VF733_00715 [Candidatus Saccharimonadales bacterium]
MDRVLAVCLDGRNRTVELCQEPDGVELALREVMPAERPVNSLYLTQDWSEVETRALEAHATSPFSEDKRFNRASGMLALIGVESQSYATAKATLDVADRSDVDAVRFCNMNGEWSEPVILACGLQETVPISSRVQLKRQGVPQKVMGVALDPAEFGATHAVLGIMADGRFNALRTYLPEVATLDEIKTCFIGVSILLPPETGTAV